MAQAATEDEAVDLALLHAELAIRGGRDAAALASLENLRVGGERGARADLRALELVLAIRARDASALHDAFLAEADQATGKGAGEAASAADALVAARPSDSGGSRIRAGAEALYRRALDRVADPRAGDARAGRHVVRATAAPRRRRRCWRRRSTWAADISTMFEVWAREKIVAIYSDELGQPDKAAEHQRRLVELTPKDVERRVRLADIEMCRARGPSTLRSGSTTCWRSPTSPAIRRWRSP